MDLKEKPGLFDKSDNILSARALNAMREADLRQITGSGVNINKYGDRIVVSGEEQLPPKPVVLQGFVVITEDDDWLECCPFAFGTMPQMYDDQFKADTPSNQLIMVAKPYDLQKTPWESQPSISPPYTTGDIIIAAKFNTGYIYTIKDDKGNDVSGDTAQQPVTWIDINTAGRNTGGGTWVEVIGNSPSRTFLYDGITKKTKIDSVDVSDGDKCWIYSIIQQEIPAGSIARGFANGKFTATPAQQGAPPEKRTLYFAASGWVIDTKCSNGSIEQTNY